MPLSRLGAATFFLGSGLLLWTLLLGDGRIWLDWQTEALSTLQKLALPKLHGHASFAAETLAGHNRWQPIVFGRGARRRLSACPVFARNPQPDSNGDCVCPHEAPACYQGGEKWCLRNDGVRDYHFFSMSCETCTCQSESASEEDGKDFLPAEACQVEGMDRGARANKLGTCTCPSERPLCVTLEGLVETPGCSLGPPDNELHANMFHADCTNCACRQACPKSARQIFADSFGDCACPPEVPICHENGVKGCQSSSGDAVSSNSYFRASCGKACECGVAVGACEPASCISTTDCVYDSCYDCEMCLGISKCPDVGVVEELPNPSGNCQCSGDLSCFQGDDELPGCPIAPFGESSTSFRANCRGCKCDHLKTGSVLLGLQCPPFAKNELPDRYGDCLCPEEATDCWENGQKWCMRNDQRRDLRYFSVRCATCECRPASKEAQLARLQPCPEFARDDLSDIYRNCICPPDKPLCVEGEWSEPNLADQPADEAASEGAGTEDGKRIGPMCNTTHGWVSSTRFRYNCRDCRCVEVEGEGSRLRQIRPDELTEHSGDFYMKHHLVVDLRAINSYDTVTDWDEAYRDITSDAIYEYARGVEGGLSYLDIPSAAVCEVVELQETRVYSDPTLETVHAIRALMDFGIMFATSENRQLASAEEVLEVNHTLGRTLSDGKVIKRVEELTPRETFLLLNFASIFNEALFAQELETQLWRRLNVTWEQVKGNLTLAEGQIIEAPRVEVIRVIVDDQAQLPELSWVGPLAQAEPDRRELDRNTGPIEEEGLPILLIVIIVAGGLFVCICCISTCYCCYERRKEAMRQQEMNMIRIGRDNNSPQGTARSKNESSPSGSPRESGRRGGRQSMVAVAGRHSLAAKNRRRESKQSILLAGGVSNENNTARSKFGMFSGRGGRGGDESPSGSPRSSRLRQSASPSRSESPSGRRSESPVGRRTQRASDDSSGRRSMSVARPQIDRKVIKRMGDLAGHKALSPAARAALEAEQEKTGAVVGRKGRSTVGANVFGRKSQAPGRKTVKGSDSPTRQDSPGENESENSPSQAATSERQVEFQEVASLEIDKPKGRCGRLLSCLGSVVKRIFSVFFLPCRLLGRCCKRRKSSQPRQSRGVSTRT